MSNKPRSNQKSKSRPIETFFVTDALHFETEYLILRLTDALRLIEKREHLVHSILECMEKVVKDDAQMGLLRKEGALFEISVNSDKARARVELRQQQVELKEQQKTFKAVISAVKSASKASRTFTPADVEGIPPDGTEVVSASISGKAIRFEGIAEAYLAEPLETSDPRVVAALTRRRIGHPVIVE